MKRIVSSIYLLSCLSSVYGEVTDCCVLFSATFLKVFISFKSFWGGDFYGLLCIETHHPRISRLQFLSFLIVSLVLLV